MNRMTTRAPRPNAAPATRLATTRRLIVTRRSMLLDATLYESLRSGSRPPAFSIIRSSRPVSRSTAVIAVDMTPKITNAALRRPAYTSRTLPQPMSYPRRARRALAPRRSHPVATSSTRVQPMELVKRLLKPQ